MSGLKHILYVEDEISIQRLVQLSLEKLGGYRVSLFDKGKEALECVSDLKPDLIMLDVMMPGMDGPQILAELRLRDDTRHIPVVFITAKARQDEINAFLSIGAQGVVTKPFDPMTLPQQLKDIWQQSAQQPGGAHVAP